MIKPLADRIVIKVIDDVQQTSGGIFIPDSAKEKPQKGEVVAVYKSAKTAFLAPYAFGQQILPVIRDIYDQNNLAVNHKQLIASAAGEVVAERLAAKLTINGIDEIL